MIGLTMSCYQTLMLEQIMVWGVNISIHNDRVIVNGDPCLYSERGFEYTDKLMSRGRYLFCINNAAYISFHKIDGIQKRVYIIDNHNVMWMQSECNYFQEFGPFSERAYKEAAVSYDEERRKLASMLAAIAHKSRGVFRTFRHGLEEVSPAEGVDIILQKRLDRSIVCHLWL